MKKRHVFSSVFAIAYLVLAAFFVVNSGAGHDWGTGAFVVLSFPLGLVALGLDYLLPNTGVIVLFPFLGFIQYWLIGYFVGRRCE